MLFDAPGMTARRLEVRPEHKAYLAAVAERIAFAGPLLDDAGAMTGSLLVIDFADRAAALAWLAAEPFTRANAARPVADDDLSEVEFNAWRVLGAHDPATTRRLEHGAAVLAVREGEHGTVVATGCTEWAWGLAGGDPAVERITLNLFERLAD